MIRLAFCLRRRHEDLTLRVTEGCEREEEERASSASEDNSESDDRCSPFQIPVQSTYPSSMSSMIHWPFSGYSYTGLDEVRQHSGVASGLNHVPEERHERTYIHEGRYW